MGKAGRDGMSSPLARAMGRSPTNPDHIHDMKAAAWHQIGFYGEHVDEIDDPWLRQAIINRATKKFGKRKDQAA